MSDLSVLHWVIRLMSVIGLIRKRLFSDIRVGFYFPRPNRSTVAATPACDPASDGPGWHPISTAPLSCSGSQGHYWTFAPPDPFLIESHLFKIYFFFFFSTDIYSFHLGLFLSRHLRHLRVFRCQVNRLISVTDLKQTTYMSIPLL